MSESQELLAEAREKAAAAYAPYSNFRVGAVAVAPDGTHYLGANVENAAYGSTICAEAVAISNAVAAGVRKIDTVVTACLDTGECYPCGNCRQLMREFGVEQVIVQDAEGNARVHAFEELMPHSFGPESLDGA